MRIDVGVVIVCSLSLSQTAHNHWLSDAFILSMKQKGQFLESLQQQLILTMVEDPKKVKVA